MDRVLSRRRCVTISVDDETAQRQVPGRSLRLATSDDGPTQEPLVEPGRAAPVHAEDVRLGLRRQPGPAPGPQAQSRMTIAGRKALQISTFWQWAILVARVRKLAC